MSSRLVRLTVIVLLSSSLLASSVVPAFAQQGAIPIPQTSVSDQINQLLKTYQASLETELANGTTQELVDPSTGSVSRILAGDSQTKMDKLWAETLAKINALEARPESARKSTAAMLHSASGLDPRYVSRVGTPYDPTAQLEEYEAGKYIYHVDIRSDRITSAWLKDQRGYTLKPIRSETQLEASARDYVSKFASSSILEGLTLTVSNKEQRFYFFRWEDPKSQLRDGTRPFVQVALSVSGDLLNFEDTLPFSSNNGALSSSGSVVPAIGANAVYSNGGTQWAWEVLKASYSVQNNAGYCYTQGSWCQPKNFYYAPSPSGNNTYNGTYHRGKWTATSSMRGLYTRTAAYIPSTHATAIVFYRKWYNGGASSVDNGVNQAIWYNTWVEMSSTLYDISRIVLPNTDEVGPDQIAWDEIWDYVP